MKQKRDGSGITDLHAVFPFNLDYIFLHHIFKIKSALQSLQTNCLKRLIVVTPIGETS